MLNTVRKATLAGLGALELTEEKLQAFLADLTARGELSEQEAREYAGHWKERFAQRQAELQREVREAVQRALRGLDVASQRDLDALADRVTALEARVSPPVAAAVDGDREC
jgi:polyhydroxyalkanoate synthesis regulator phasin